MAADDPFSWVGRTLDGRYRALEVTGEGGFGVVYRAHHQKLDVPIAIKCLKLPAKLTGEHRAEFERRFIEEGRVLHKLSRASAAIVQALDVGAATSPSGHWTPYIVLEWLDGCGLDVELKARKKRGAPRWSLAEALELLTPAAQALGIAHRERIAHRDVKPANLFLAELGGQRTLKVLDFGIAKVIHESLSETEAMRVTGQAPPAFTPQYGAPEQFNRRKGATGPWTDVHALALVLVELLAGRPALEGDDLVQLMSAALDAEHRPTPRAMGIEVSDAVEHTLARALAISPAERPPNAEQFWRELLEAAGVAAHADFPSERSLVGSRPSRDEARSRDASGAAPADGSHLGNLGTAEFLADLAHADGSSSARSGAASKAGLGTGGDPALDTRAWLEQEAAGRRKPASPDSERHSDLPASAAIAGAALATSAKSPKSAESAKRAPLAKSDEAPQSAALPKSAESPQSAASAKTATGDESASSAVLAKSAESAIAITNPTGDVGAAGSATAGAEPRTRSKWMLALGGAAILAMGLVLGNGLRREPPPSPPVGEPPARAAEPPLADTAADTGAGTGSSATPESEAATGAENGTAASANAPSPANPDTSASARDGERATRQTASEPAPRGREGEAAASAAPLDASASPAASGAPSPSAASGTASAEPELIAPPGYCEADCRVHGECTPTLIGKVVVCRAASDADCKNTYTCKVFGQCWARKGLCRAVSIDDCKKSMHCKDLQCTVKNGKCIEEITDCTIVPVCKAQGRCTAKNNNCIATSDAQCKASDACKKHGWCRNVGTDCVK